jgi:hypothetical protein
MAAALATTAKADPGNRMSIARARIQNGSAKRPGHCTGSSFGSLLSYGEASNKKTVGHLPVGAAIWRAS